MGTPCHGARKSVAATLIDCRHPCGILKHLVMGKARESNMKRFAMALLLGAFATTALAADARYFVVTDTVGN